MIENHKFLAYLSLVTALSISAVAIYYSVAGLIAIFAAAPVAIAIMGGILETGKLVVAVWLHRYWYRAVMWLKLYLGFGLLVLMILTSVGIFGFLSKSHTEQTSMNQESRALIERTDTQIARQQAIIARAEEKINQTETVGSGADVNIQSQIDREQERISLALDRLQESEQSLSVRIEPFQRELDQIGSVLTALQNAINQNDIKQAQSIVGTRPDGQYGPATAQRIEQFRNEQNHRRNVLLERIESIRTSDTPAISMARSQIEDSNQLINRLRAQLGQTVSEDLGSIIDEETQKIRTANIELDELTARKFELEATNRALEAEVGPIKYVAEFIYGESDQTLLEKAVRWMIIMIVVVFDPLAIMLLIASQYTFNYQRELDAKKLELKPETEDQKDSKESKESIGELINRLIENFDTMDEQEVKKVLDEDPEIKHALEEHLNKQQVVKPKEDIHKPREGWLSQ